MATPIRGIFRRILRAAHPATRAASRGGRRILKQSTAQDGRAVTLYGWDGDTLAFESGNAHTGSRPRATHYVYEPGSFVPLAQAGREGYITLHVVSK